NLVGIAQRPRSAGSNAAHHTIGAEQSQLKTAGTVAAPLQRELQSTRQFSGDREHIFFARDRFSKTLLGGIRRDRQPRQQRFGVPAQRTIELLQYIWPKAGS